MVLETLPRKRALNSHRPIHQIRNQVRPKEEKNTSNTFSSKIIDFTVELYFMLTDLMHSLH